MANPVAEFDATMGIDEAEPEIYLAVDPADLIDLAVDPFDLHPRFSAGVMDVPEPELEQEPVEQQWVDRCLTIQYPDDNGNSVHVHLGVGRHDQEKLVDVLFFEVDTNAWRESGWHGTWRYDNGCISAQYLDPDWASQSEAHMWILERWFTDASNENGGTDMVGVVHQRGQRTSRLGTTATRFGGEA